MNQGPYTCAFRGRRDSYQVPLALEEAGILDSLITDAWAFPALKTLARLLPARLRWKFSQRHCTGIPDNRVRCLWGSLLHERRLRLAGVSASEVFAKVDRDVSWTAEKVCAERRTNLLLYSSYAYEAFEAVYAHRPRRVLFQYHPHLATEESIMTEDASTFPFATTSREADGGPRKLVGVREREGWRKADLILCASSFTLASLVKAGADPALGRVIPYGVDALPAIETRRPRGFSVLFVGTGTQRKGLHHLLSAWRRARLPSSSSLTLVCRESMPYMVELAHNTPRVKLIGEVTPAELGELYASHALFAMPSLVEGFGQVYLEALSHGTPVLGTENTCLPDLGGEHDGIFLSRPGDVDNLVAMLERLSVELAGDVSRRIAAHRCATKFTWARFRGTLAAALLEGHAI